MTEDRLDKTSPSTEPLVRVRDLQVRFESKEHRVTVVDGVSFDLHAGETLCLLGESGSGKSVTMRALMRLMPSTARLSGSVRVGGHDILALPEPALERIRGPLVSMIFQEPMTSFDPVFTVGQQIIEVIRTHEGISAKAARTRALELFETVQIPSAARRLDAYPHELSGGLRQRAMIALALSCRPSLLLADEPTTALDASVQIQILLLLRRLREALGMSTIIVTHDLGVAAEVADRVIVMYAGQFVETGSVRDVLNQPRHPYTRGLMASTLKAGSGHQRLQPIPGAPPDLRNLPAGCRFAPRCPDATEACTRTTPPLLALGMDRRARCLYAGTTPAPVPQPS